MKFNLKVRDLINIAIFTVIYYIVFVIATSIGMISVAFTFIGLLLSILVDGIVIIFLISRSTKLGVLTLTGFLLGLTFLMTGNTGWIIPGFVLFGFLADLIATNFGKLAHLTRNRAILAYAVFCLWYLMPLSPAIFASDAYYARLDEVMGVEYSDVMQQILGLPTLFAFGLAAFIFGLAGGWIGTKVARKHFMKAGLTK